MALAPVNAKKYRVAGMTPTYDDSESYSAKTNQSMANLNKAPGEVNIAGGAAQTMSPEYMQQAAKKQMEKFLQNQAKYRLAEGQRREVQSFLDQEEGFKKQLQDDARRAIKSRLGEVSQNIKSQSVRRGLGDSGITQKTLGNIQGEGAIASAMGQVDVGKLLQEKKEQLMKNYNDILVGNYQLKMQKADSAYKDALARAQDRISQLEGVFSTAGQAAGFYAGYRPYDEQRKDRSLGGM